ncbi:DUF190 domain-containing protein [Sulfobacillus harzensis]|uniref:DUF190 domain-containing protein n=1 Tax=Sulfobacillus harzensis TaxID=2729629 RepID=UPI0030842125
MAFHPVKASRLRVYIGESSRHGQSLYHAIVVKARQMGLAGATVVRGVEGYGHSSRIHSANLLTLSGDLPLVIEIIDRAERVDKFAATVADMLDHGLITVDTVEVRHFGRSENLPE